MSNLVSRHGARMLIRALPQAPDRGSWTGSTWARSHAPALRTACTAASVAEAPMLNDTKLLTPHSNKLLLVDGHSLAYRAYYGMVNDRSMGLMTSTGIPTSICHGFLKMLLVVMRQQQPHAVVVAFDFGGSSIRRQLEPTYKISREPPPKQVNMDLDNLRHLLKALGLQEAWHEGYEGDDIVATLARYGSQQGYRVEILTNDNDLLQVVDDEGGVSVLMLTIGGVSKKGFSYREMRCQEVVARCGVLPTQVADLKGLQGDASDDIKGVRGIGHKTAAKLLSEFGSLDAIYENLQSVTPNQRKKLEEGRASAFISRQLATVMLDAPVGELKDISQARLQGFHVANFSERLQELELNHLLGCMEDFQSLFCGDCNTAVAPTPITAAPQGQE